MTVLLNAAYILSLIRKGQAELDRQHDEAELKKRGELRGGSVGCLTECGKCLGKCPRRSFLRLRGYQDDVEESTALMFISGRVNEEVWRGILNASGYQGKILREQEIPIRYVLDSKTVSNSPDTVLCDDEGNPKLGVELKRCSSYSTAKSVAFELIPKTEHVIQAAHYSHKLGVPWVLCYTNDCMQSIPSYDLGKYKKDDPRIKYTKAGKPSAIKPFQSFYDLKFENGNVLYKHSSQTSWTPTLITVEGIERYYQHVINCDRDNQVPCRVSDVTLLGEPVGRWSMCEPRYCAFSEACAEHENNFQRWFDECRKICEEGK